MRTWEHDTHFIYMKYIILSKPCDSQNFYILSLKKFLNAKSYIILIFFFLKKLVNLRLLILINYILTKKYVLSIFKCYRIENYHLLYII